MHEETRHDRAHGAVLAPSSKMRATFTRELQALALPSSRAAQPIVTEDDLAPLPSPAQRYFRFVGAVDRTRDWSFRAHIGGRFRLGPEKPWMPCECWQYDTRFGPARIFHMRVRLAGVVPVYVRDSYVRGEGRMLGRLLDRVAIVDAADEKIHLGELTTYLNDAVLLAPTLLLGANTGWLPVDDESFDVSLTDRGRTVSARVSVDERGAVTDFSTTDRFGRDPDGGPALVRARWTTPVRGWTRGPRGMRPTGGKAVWHFSQQSFEYADFDFAEDSFEFDVEPSQR